ncbi:MAG: tetratricopeptide repeat protein [Thermodesulfobacteriota bacterium]
MRVQLALPRALWPAELYTCRLARHNEAFHAYRQAIRIDPEDAFAWYNLGVNYLVSGNRGAAMDAVKELPRLNPALADELFDIVMPR